VLNWRSWSANFHRWKTASTIRSSSKGDVLETDGHLLGVVTDVLDSGGTHILQVGGAQGEILIPFAQAYLRKVDLGQRRIEVVLPEGLADLNK
jgi:ribosomal 30S subunit maturation factor RimM